MVTQQPLYLIDSSNILLNALHHGLDENQCRRGFFLLLWEEVNFRCYKDGFKVDTHISTGSHMKGRCQGTNTRISASDIIIHQLESRSFSKSSRAKHHLLIFVE